MSSNVGIADRIVRIMLGIALLAWPIFYSHVPYSAIGWIGAVVLATGLIGWCGLYRILGISTVPKAGN